MCAKEDLESSDVSDLFQSIAIKPYTICLSRPSERYRFHCVLTGSDSIDMSESAFTDGTFNINFNFQQHSNSSFNLSEVRIGVLTK